MATDVAASESPGICFCRNGTGVLNLSLTTIKGGRKTVTYIAALR